MTCRSALQKPLTPLKESMFITSDRYTNLFSICARQTQVSRLNCYLYLLELNIRDGYPLVVR